MAENAKGRAKAAKGMPGAFPPDAGTFSDVFRLHASFMDRMSRVVLAAAERLTGISATWTRSTLGGLGNVADARNGPSGCAAAMGAFAAAQAELGVRSAHALADVATTAQVETVKLMIAAEKRPGAGVSKPARRRPRRSGLPSQGAKETPGTAGKATANR